MIQHLNRPALKAQTRELLKTAQVSPKAMTALYLGICYLLELAVNVLPVDGLASRFFSIFSSLAGSVLFAGFLLYCMGIRNRERMESATLFDGFSFVTKIVALSILLRCLITFWSMFFLIPGIIASYRYSFALYNLCEDPGLGVFQALNMSRQQTRGYKMQLFQLDLSYLGWALLAALPEIACLGVQSVRIVQSAASAADLLALTASVSAASLPVLLVCDLWSIAVALFYFPHRHCVSLAYFEAAKESLSRRDASAPGGPDDFGAF